MKTIKLFTLALIGLVFFGGCEKESSLENGNNPSANNDSGIRIAPDGRVIFDPNTGGVLHTFKHMMYTYNNGSNSVDSVEDEYANAWFGDPNNSIRIGIVKVGDSLLQQTPGVYMNHYAFDGHTFKANDEVAWSVKGNAQLGIPGFYHYDVELMPRIPSFVLPDSVDINLPLIIRHQPVGSTVLGVACLVNFHNPVVLSIRDREISQVVVGNATGVTSASAALNPIANPPQQKFT